MLRALLLEDDAGHAQAVSLALKLEGYDVVVCPTMADAEAKTLDQSYDLLVVDIDLPDGNGLNFVKEFREHDTRAAVVICSGNRDEETVLKGFEYGADDYVRKPVGVKELLARMNRFVEGPKDLKVGKLHVQPLQRTARWEQTEILLTPREFQLLVLLAQKPSELVSRDRIQSAMERASDEATSDRAIDIHVSRLRKKIKMICGTDVEIQSEYGAGYRMRVKP